MSRRTVSSSESSFTAVARELKSPSSITSPKDPGGAVECQKGSGVRQISKQTESTCRARRTGRMDGERQSAVPHGQAVKIYSVLIVSSLLPFSQPDFQWSRADQLVYELCSQVLDILTWKQCISIPLNAFTMLYHNPRLWGISLGIYLVESHREACSNKTCTNMKMKNLWFGFVLSSNFKW